MKKKILGLLLVAGLVASMPMAAYGEKLPGSSKWKVSFTEAKEMETNFKNTDLTEVIYGMQPGDTAVLKMNLENENSITTDWYMTNKVLYSLEERSQNSETGGGAYTYRLVYTNKDGEKNVLFDSDTVGGEGESKAGEGLKQATNALDEYMYLDTLATGDKGSLTLRVGLDGETQGNDYQDTLADLQMQFAVELSNTPPAEATPTNRPTTTVRPTTTPVRPGTTVIPGRPTTETLYDLGTPLAMVQTGDDTEIDKYLFAACISGGFLLILSVYGQAVRRKRRREEE